MSLRRDFRDAPLRTVAEVVVLSVLGFVGVAMLATLVWLMLVLWTVIL